MFKKSITVVMGFAFAMLCSGIFNVNAATSGTINDPAVTSDKLVTSHATVNLTTSGTISLDSAPSFDFGEQPITKDGLVTPAKAATSDPVQVTNPGLASGWKVSVGLGAFSSKAGYTLKGAQIVLTPDSSFSGDSKISGSDMQDVSGKKDDNYTFTTIDNVSSGAMIPTAFGTTLNAGSGETSNIFTAAINGGVGIWQSAYSAELRVPAGNVEGDYTADVTWTITDAP